MSQHRVLGTSATKFAADADLIARAVDALGEAAAASNACADACVSEGDMDMLAQCVTLDLHAADISATTARVLSRNAGNPSPEVLRTQLEAACTALETCASECESHDHEHCAACAEACRQADELVHEVLEALA